MLLILAFATFLGLAEAEETTAAPPPPTTDERSHEELCADYRRLSQQLTVDYLAVQEAAANSEQQMDLLPEIKANSNYAKTRIAFKQVVADLGTRTCPYDLEDDFPPLVE